MLSNRCLVMNWTLILLILLVAGCTTTQPAQPATPAQVAIPTPIALNTQTTEMTSQATATLPPSASMTETLPITSTPSPTVDLSSFPATILYVGMGGCTGCGGGPEEEEIQKFPRGLTANILDDYKDLHKLVVAMWGLPLDETLGIAVASPDGSQIFSEGFATVRQADGSYAVEWPGISPDEFESGEAYMRQDGKSFIVLTLWWPGGLPEGGWSVVVTAGNISVSGTLQVAVPSHPWVSLQAFDDKLYAISLGGCLVVSGDQRKRPFQVSGGGFTPGQVVQLALYYQSNEHANYIRVGAYTAQTDISGRISLTLQAELLDPAGIYLLVALTDGTRPFFQEGNTGVLAEGSDCFNLR